MVDSAKPRVERVGERADRSPINGRERVDLDGRKVPPLGDQFVKDCGGGGLETAAQLRIRR